MDSSSDDCRDKFQEFLDPDYDFDSIHHQVSYNTLRVILEWSKYHLNCSPEEDNQLVGNGSEWKLCQWDQHFFNKYKNGIFTIMNTAEFLGIRKLQDACAVAVARLMKGMSVNKLKQEFSLEFS